MCIIKGLVLMAVAASSLFIAQNVRAQYPPVNGNLTAQASQTTSTTGAAVLLTGQLLDSQGVGVAGADMTFSITTEPGGPDGDAAVGSKTITKKTDATGVATTMLRTGSTPGIIVIAVSAGGYQTQVLVNVAGVAASSPLPPAAPVQITPPQTGSGGLAN